MAQTLAEFVNHVMLTTTAGGDGWQAGLGIRWGY